MNDLRQVDEGMNRVISSREVLGRLSKLKLPENPLGYGTTRERKKLSPGEALALLEDTVSMVHGAVEQSYQFS